MLDGGTAQASPGNTGTTINFQGRLLTNTGAVVADGSYNMEFKLYKNGPGNVGGDTGGTLLWTEDWVYGTGTPDNRVVVKNGYYSVNLGSITALPSAATLDESVLWLSMNIETTVGGASTAQCTGFSSGSPAACTGGDGEMLPMKAIGSTPYALNAANANQVNSYGLSNNFLALAAPSGIGAVNGAAGSVPGTVCYAVTATNSSGETVDANNSGTVTPGGTHMVTVSWSQVSGATGYKIYRNTSCAFTSGSLLLTTISSGSTVTYSDNATSTSPGVPPTTVTGSTVDLQAWNSQTASLLALQNSASTNLFTVDSSGNTYVAGVVTVAGGASQDFTTAAASTATGLTIQPGASSLATSTGPTLKLQGGNDSGGTAATGGTVAIQGGNATGGGGTQTGGNVTVDAGTGSTSNGSVGIGTVNDAAVTIGKTTGTGALTLGQSTQTESISIGNAAVASGKTQTITIGSGATSGNGIDTVTVGDINNGSSLSLYGGTNGVSVQAAATGTLSLGTTNANNLQLGAQGSTANADTVTVATSTGAAQIIQIGGTGATGASNSGTTVTSQAGQTSQSLANSGDTIKTYTNSATAFQLQSASGTSGVLLDADTSNMRLGVGVTYAAMGTPSGLASSPASGGTLAAGAYIYEVTAIDSAGGETLVSGEVTGTTSAGNLTNALTWTAVSGASGYKIYRTAKSGGTGTEKYLAGSTGPAYNDTGSLTLGTTSAPGSNTAYVSTNIANSSLELAVGGGGSPTGQLYVGGTTPTTALSTIPLLGAAEGIFVQGKYIYAIDATNGNLQIFDASNPSAPVQVGQLSLASSTQPWGIEVVGNYAYLTNYGTNQVQIVDVSNPATPTSLSTVTTANGVCVGPRSIEVEGHYAYVVSDGKTVTANSCFQVFDVSNPAIPVQVGSNFTTGISQPKRVYVQGRYAYVANSSSATVETVDISNPAAPSDIAVSAAFTSPHSLTVAGRYAYVADYSASALEIVDESTPSVPTTASTTSTGATSNPQGVYVQGRYAYVVDGTTGNMKIFDVSNPSAPQLVGTVTTGTDPIDVMVVGRYAYVLGESSDEIQIFDVGGTYDQQLQAGGLETGTLEVDNNASIQNNLDVRGGAEIASGAEVQGSLDVSGTAAFTSTSPSAFVVQNASGSSLLNLDTSNTKVTIATTANGGELINDGSTLDSAKNLGNLATGAIGTAAATVDVYTSFVIPQTTASVSVTIPSPTDTTAGRLIFIANTGSVPITVAGITLSNGSSMELFWTGSGGAWTTTAVSTGVSIVGTYSGSSQVNGASISGNTITFGPADTTNPGMVSTGTQTFGGAKTIQVTSTSAFVVQSTGPLSILTVDTSGDNVVVGSSTANTNAIQLVLNNYSTTADPTGIPGGMYYNTSLAQFRCYQNSMWKNCGFDGDSLTESGFTEDDFYGNSATAGTAPWTCAALTAGGTFPAATSVIAGHVGVDTVKTTASTSTGYQCSSGTVVSFGGGETFETLFEPLVFSSTTLPQYRFGFSGVTWTSGLPPSNGCYMLISSPAAATGTATANCTLGGTLTGGATTLTGMTVNTWYLLKIQVNSAASGITFSIYNAATGAQLWSDSSITSANMPIGTSMVSGFVGYATGNAAITSLENIDSMSFFYSGYR